MPCRPSAAWASTWRCRMARGGAPPSPGPFAAAARLLAGPLRDGVVSPQRLAQVRWRRLLPTVVTQLVQRQIQVRVLSRILAGDQPIGTPRILRLIDRHPVLQGLPARAIGIGVLPEHARPSLSRGVAARP